METLRRKRNDKKKLKEQIVETAMEAFTKLGIRCVRMDDIALSLSISKRTLYELFRDKENLLLEGLRMQQQQMNEAMIEVTTRTENVLEVTSIIASFICCCCIRNPSSKRFSLSRNSSYKVRLEMEKI